MKQISDIWRDFLFFLNGAVKCCFEIVQRIALGVFGECFAIIVRSIRQVSKHGA